ncbi:hypothetical protein GCK72_020056 [Caenorhabditis remanei]|uniref:Uncharacterized protein n=1 Tax=Caenorhabditis remanei TaxID=31234 RepID=A0A6A5GGF8_CAERE|nr:hypothetical protein GCK72_020056 [Caenorhabditis remanei]KAF1753499.1 hypothetical protein GCK72_020056 [Caenorhabditis remanei]
MAGLYRNTIEAMLYTPVTAPKKKSFEDEVLTGSRKVSKLLNKFETGHLDITVEEVSEIHGESENSEEEWDLDDTIFDEDEACEDVPPVPKPRTTFLTSTPKKKETPLPETPILGRNGRQTFCDGYTDLRTKFDRMDLEYRTPEVTRQKTIGVTNVRSTTTVSHQFAKEIRDEVHEKFLKYFKWSNEILRTIAIHVSELRLDVLSRIPIDEQDENVICMKKIYKMCMKGNHNKELDALCSALFDLLDDRIQMKTLSIHEEYVVFKYNRKA